MELGDNDSIGAAATASTVRNRKISSAEDSGSNAGPSKAPFAGMGKTSVVQLSQTTFWTRLRRSIHFLFWLCSFCVLIAVIFLTIQHNQSCEKVVERKWWQEASIYQIYPRSFADSDGNGVGDLRGIIGKVDYLREMGVDAVWISPFYLSPMKDFGYDVTDYRSVDPLFGTMADFDDLLTALTQKGIKLIIDFIPNHTSDQSVWFNKSVYREDPYTNYYIWKDCMNFSGHVVPPTNWISMMGGSVWAYHPIRKQCYFHQYLQSQPDMNIRNHQVRQELDEVLRFWLDRGVRGVRVDAVESLYEVLDLEDEVPSGLTNDTTSYRYLHHNLTWNLVDVMDSVNRWRGLLDSYSTPGDERVMITEAYGKPKDLMFYYGWTKNGGAQLPFNFQLIGYTASCDGLCISRLVRSWLDVMPGRETATWVLSNHDNSRLSSRASDKMVDSMNMLLLLLPGTSTTYYGDELGMSDIDISGRLSVDPLGVVDKTKSRDPERSPMQWSSKPEDCYGFTSNCTASWLPPHPNASLYNVETERDDPFSHLSVYKQLVKLKKSDAFSFGKWAEHVVTSRVYSFIRYIEGDMYLVVINAGNSTVTEHLNTGMVSTATGKIEALSSAYSTDSDYKTGDSVSLDSVRLLEGGGIVFSL